MSVSTEWKWIAGDDGSTALQTVTRAVRRLTRARTLQRLVALECDGLFFGLLASSAAAAAIRLGLIPYPLGSSVGVVILAALVVSTIVAWRRRPDDLETAIVADLRLNLQQRLSTTWELARSGADPGGAEQLAAQTVAARLRPGPEGVFPLHLGSWGRMIPIAAGVLLLVSIVDVDRARAPPADRADEQLIDEGLGLREFGRRMEARALGDGLPKSLEAARSVHRLGTQMESGMLDRGAALARLRELETSLGAQRRAASGTQRSRSGALDAGTSPGPALLGGADGAELIEKLLDGSVSVDELRELLGDGVGLDGERLERALARLAAGDAGELRELLDSIGDADRAAREAGEIERAEARVRRSRRNLGDSEQWARDGSDEPSRPSASDEDAGFDGLGGGGKGDGDGDEAGRLAPPRGGAHGRQRAGDLATPAVPTDAPRIGPVMRPESRYGEGTVFSSEALVTPSAGAPTVAATEIDARFVAQLEAVLAREDYPPHYKSFVRRYFLNLTEGAPGNSTPSEAPSQ